MTGQTSAAGFFEPGLTYANAAPYSAPVYLPVIHRFHCLAIAAHPALPELHAVGWAETSPGVWTAQSIPAEHYRPEDWSEIR